MDKKIIRKSIKSIRNIVKECESAEDTEFASGETTIPLMAPTFGTDEITEAIHSLLSKEVTMGNKVKIFEEAFSRYIGAKYAVMVNSGSSANLLALSCLSDQHFSRPIRKGAEIITPAVTWSTTVFPISDIGAKPVFVDVDLETLTVDMEQAEDAISDETAALMPVHLLGSPCNMDALVKMAGENNLFLIEDACEAHGAEWHGKKIGSFGDVATFSFFFSHHISTIEGGMVLTDDDEIYRMLKSKRAHGWIRERDDKKAIADTYPGIDPRFLFVTSGFNLRPTEIQGAFGMHQIKKLEKFLRIRIRNSRYLNKILQDYSNILVVPKEAADSRHAWFGHPLIIKEDAGFARKDLVRFLNKKGIESRPIMAGDITEQPVIKDIPHRVHRELKNSKLIHRNGLFIPNHQGIDKERLEYIAGSLIEFLEKNARMTSR